MWSHSEAHPEEANDHADDERNRDAQSISSQQKIWQQREQLKIFTTSVKDLKQITVMEQALPDQEEAKALSPGVRELIDTDLRRQSDDESSTQRQGELREESVQERTSSAREN